MRKTHPEENLNTQQKSENIFQSYINNAPDGVFVADENGKYLETNPAAEKITGYTREELLSMSINQLLSPESVEKGRQHFTRVKNTGSSSGELVFVHKNGSKRWWSVDAVKLSETRYLGFTKDITKQKSIENELRDKDEKYSKILLKIEDVVGIIDPAGITRYISPNVYRCFGWKPEDIIGTETWKRIHRKDRERIQKEFQELLNKNNSQKSDNLRYECKDGSYKWIRISAINLINDSVINGILYSCHDITGHRQNTQALAESESRFKALHDASFGGITIHDKGVILECNKGLTDISGYAYDELIGMDGLLLIAESSRDFVMNKIISGYEEPYEAVGLRKNGTEYPVRLEARNIPYKGKTVRTVEFRDISDQKQTEINLAEEKEQLAVTLRSIGDGVITTDRNGNITMINKIAEMLTGWTSEEAYGKPLHDVFYIINGITRDKCKNMVNRVLSSGEIVELPNQTCLIAKNGREIIVADSGAPIHDKDNKIIGVVIVFRDLTEKMK